MVLCIDCLFDRLGRLVAVLCGVGPMAALGRGCTRFYWWLQSWLVPRNLSAIAPIERLSSRVVRVLGANPGPMTLQGTNTYLVGAGRRRVLVDTGSANISEYLRRLDHVLTTDNAELHHVILTHWHSDHVGGLADVVRQFRPAHVSKIPCGRDRVACDVLSDGDVVQVEGSSLHVLHTPGHTVDHVALLLEEEQAVFSGDCVLGETSAVFENLRQYMSSLRRIRQLSPRLIYPGHGAVVRDPARKLDQYIEHRQARERQLLGALQDAPAGLSLGQLVRRVYPHLPFTMRPAARTNVNNHLDKLVEDGVVRSRDDGRFVLRQK